MALAPTFLPHGAKLFCVGLTNGYQSAPTVQGDTREPARWLQSQKHWGAAGETTMRVDHDAGAMLATRLIFRSFIAR